MKIVPILAFVFLNSFVFVSAIAQPGKYAGTEFKKIINTRFSDESNISALKGYQFHEGTLLNSLDDPERFFLNVYAKGTTRVILFTVLIDTAKFVYEIVDVIQLKNISEQLEFKSVTCRQNKEENSEILALVKPAEKQYFNDIKKAWICDKNKRSFRAIALKGIDCLNEGYEQY